MRAALSVVTITTAGIRAPGAVPVAMDTGSSATARKAKVSATLTGTARVHSSVEGGLVAALTDSTAVPEVNLISHFLMRRKR